MSKIGFIPHSAFEPDERRSSRVVSQSTWDFLLSISLPEPQL